jgi:hypothetical protein
MSENVGASTSRNPKGCTGIALSIFSAAVINRRSISIIFKEWLMNILSLAFEIK